MEFSFCFKAIFMRESLLLIARGLFIAKDSLDSINIFSCYIRLELKLKNSLKVEIQTKR